MVIIKKILDLAVKHKLIVGAIIIALVVGGYFGYKALNTTKQETRYVLAAVEKGTIVNSVSGTGQVSTSKEVEIKPKTSGDIVYVGVTEGQSVKAGTLVVSLDTSDAQKTVRDAKVSLESAELTLKKLLEPEDELTILQAENSLTAAKESKASAEDDLEKAYESGYNNVSSAFLTLPNIMTQLDTILFGSTLGESSQWNLDYFQDAVQSYDAKIVEYRESTLKSYQKALTEYNTNFSDYKSTSRTADNETIKELIDETYQTTKDISEAIKNANNLIQFYEDKMKDNNQTPLVLADTYLSNLSSYTSSVNSQLTTLLSSQTSIENYKTSITSYDRSIAEKTLSLADLKDDVDEVELKTQQLTVQQKKDSLTDAQSDLANCYVYAPFAGIISSIDVEKGDTASSGSSVATIVTDQMIAEVSLSETDIPNVKVGQKATLTFDAIEDLSITGEVAQVDIVGTVSSGVVTYNVKINFDTQDERVKSGMSVSASIITKTSQDVLVVSSSAIKTSDDASYVLQLDSQYTDTGSTGVISATAPTQTQIETGLSDDSYTEITSGLKEGDLIITKTITTTSSGSTTKTNKNTNTNKSSSSSSSILGGTSSGPGGGMPPQ